MENQMVKTSPRYCMKCRYAYKHSNTDVICGYIVETQKMRGCPIGMCDKFEPKGRKRRVKLK